MVLALTVTLAFPPCSPYELSWRCRQRCPTKARSLIFRRRGCVISTTSVHGLLSVTHGLLSQSGKYGQSAFDSRRRERRTLRRRYNGISYLEPAARGAHICVARVGSARDDALPSDEAIEPRNNNCALRDIMTKFSPRSRQRDLGSKSQAVTTDSSADYRRGSAD